MYAFSMGRKKMARQWHYLVSKGIAHYNQQVGQIIEIANDISEHLSELRTIQKYMASKL